MDNDGNLWAGDSGPFGDDPSKAGRGYQFFKFSPDGELLLTLGEAGVSKAGTGTFIAPTACAIAPNGDIFIADGHFPRPSTSQQDGDRIVRFTSSGKYVGSWGRKGSGPGDMTVRMPLPSIPKDGCSSPTGPTTGSRSSTGT